MTGLEKIEAAFSKAGTAEIPVVICYEDIFIRDHWQQLTTLPWWVAFSPDIDHALAWRLQAISSIGQDWFLLPACPSRLERQAQAILETPQGIFLSDQRTGELILINKSLVSGWELFDSRYSGHVQNPPLTREEVDLRIPLHPYQLSTMVLLLLMGIWRSHDHGPRSPGAGPLCLWSLSATGDPALAPGSHPGCA